VSSLGREQRPAIQGGRLFERLSFGGKLASPPSRYPGHQARSLPDLNYRIIPLQLQRFGAGLIVICTFHIFRVRNVIVGVYFVDPVKCHVSFPCPGPSRGTEASGLLIWSSDKGGIPLLRCNL
jgi:hypothetical protein